MSTKDKRTERKVRGKLSPDTAKVRDEFFAHRRKNTGKPNNHLSPIQKRMRSGSF